jgi:MFS family permease
MTDSDSRATINGRADRGALRPLPVFLASLVLVELFSGVLQVYFIPVYGTLAAKFNVSIGTLSWALIGFTLATAVSTPVYAKLGDLYGHRKILRIEVAIVAVGSVLIAIAPDFAVLVLGRILQGTFAAYLPLMFGLVRSRYPHPETRRAVSYLTSVLIFGVLVGSVLTGVLVRYTNGPTWALWLPAIGTLAGFAGLLVVRGEPAPQRESGHHVDWPGAILLAAGLALVLLGLSEGSSWGWSSARIVGFLIGGVVLLAVWCMVELRTAHPLADLRFLFRPVFLPVYAIGFCIYFGGIGGQVAASTFMAAPGHLLGYGLSLTPLAISVALVPVYVLTFLAVAFTARLGRVIGFRPIMGIGCTAGFIGFLGLAIWHNGLAPFLVLYAVASLGTGFIESSTRTLVVDGLREGEIAMGEGIYELAITVGAAVGSAVLGAVLSANASKVPGLALQKGYEQAWLIAGIVCLAAAVIAAGYILAERHSRAAVSGVTAAKIEATG